MAKNIFSLNNPKLLSTHKDNHVFSFIHSLSVFDEKEGKLQNEGSLHLNWEQLQGPNDTDGGKTAIKQQNWGWINVHLWLQVYSLTAILLYRVQSATFLSICYVYL